MANVKNVAVILAGGAGVRLGSVLPKQFLKVAGKKVIEHTLDVFQNHPLIDEIVVVSHIDYIRDVEDISERNSYTKLKKILVGGKERCHSSITAINAYDEEVNLIFHDSVRPLVNDRIINDCLKALERYSAVDVAVPTTDTIIQVDDNDEIVRIPSRSLLRNGQTPQAFKRSIIKLAYEKALLDSEFKTTDDCEVVLKYLPDEPIYVVKGEQFNMKLTYNEDIFLLDKLFQLRSTNQSLYLDPIHAKNIADKVIVIFGGTYGIGQEVAKLCTKYKASIHVFSHSCGVDVSDIPSVKNALQIVYAKEGRIDWIVNTAGLLDKQVLANMDYNTIQQEVNVNYMGCIIIAKEAYPYLKESKGSLLFYTSSSYTRGRSLYSVYSSSKAAIVNLVQALGEEWFEYGIRINCINPERTKTPMRIRNFGNEPENTLLNPQDVATASINTLLSDMTGEVVDVKRR
ncbi:MAG: bifunctional cytidylyltransferase/SDR family oxidoreductase [Bacteroides sp.]|nr:bifunctional cytidylyltransferase/SDR family oxidoreductase [Bacteroides sp.]